MRIFVRTIIKNTRYMATNLKTSFAGIELKNPIIASASPMTSSVEQCIELENAGVAAIVVKSIFEESVAHNANRLADVLSHGEENDYLDGYIAEQMVTEWRTLLRGIKQSCSIPVVASIAARSVECWAKYAAIATEEGVDALELNLMNIGLTSRHMQYGTVEQKQTEAVEAVLKATHLPVVVKLASNLSNPARLVDRLDACGVKGVVLYNRPYPIDIDVEKLEFTIGHSLTSAANLSTPLRWTGILSAEVPAVDYALSGGVQSWQDVIKAILVGASAVEVCSTLYHNGLGCIREMLKGVEEWQVAHFEESIFGYRGKMNASKEQYGEELKRTQHYHFSI